MLLLMIFIIQYKKNWRRRMFDKKPLFELLPKVIATELHIKPDDGILQITEQKEQATCRWVEIILKQSVSSFCFTIDKERKIGNGDPIFPFFNPTIPNICSKNDAILICQKQQEIYVFLIELKSKNSGKYLTQLKAAQLFVQFIFERLTLYKMCKDNLTDVKFRGILFSNMQTSKEKPSKHTPIIFKDKNGLLISKQKCHNTYNLTTFLPQNNVKTTHPNLL